MKPERLTKQGVRDLGSTPKKREIDPPKAYCFHQYDAYACICDPTEPYCLCTTWRCRKCGAKR